MAYSVNTDTKVATYNGDTYPPTQKTNAKTDETTLVAKTEDECKEMKELRDAAPAYHLQRLREKRNSMLSKSDWRANSDVTMSDEWKTYRQALRDITKTYKSIQDDGFEWPTEPS
jgi:hypothetical protein|tara:strand:- start:498 stop:842 length:345 start_codon:yes stop_codon:yes gene_type:complete